MKASPSVRRPMVPHAPGESKWPAQATVAAIDALMLVVFTRLC
jgi:hypothetical protein